MSYFSKLGLLDSSFSVAPKAQFTAAEEDKQSGQQGAKKKEEVLSGLIRQVKCGEIQDILNELQKFRADGFNLNAHILGGKTYLMYTNHNVLTIGWNCLHYASHMGRKPVVRLLLDQ